MREILFRGKTDDGKWVEGVFIPDCLESLKNQQVGWGWIKRHWLTGEFDVHTETVEVIRETVGQFTGLTDKNGKKIFEGDIVKFHTETYTQEYDTIGVIEYFNGAFGIAYGNGKHLLEFNSMSMYVRWYEVIGNIHDNPELLEVEQ